MNSNKEKELDLIVTRAWDNVIANLKNGTSYSHWKRNPGLAKLYDQDGNPREDNEDFHAGSGKNSSIDNMRKDSGADKPVKLENPSQTVEQADSNKSAIPLEKESHKTDPGEGTQGADDTKKTVDWKNHPGRKYSYSSFTLKFISDNKDEINKRAREEGVSPIALAMVIGDELQTRKDTFYKAKGNLDAIQDRLAYEGDMDDDSDIGAGNLRIGKAKELMRQKGWKIDDIKLQQYLLSDKGTIHFASLALKEAEEVMGPHLDKKSMPDHVYSQHLVEGYRQGPNNRMNKRFNAEKEAKRELEILKAPDAVNSTEAIQIYGKDIWNDYELRESTRTPLRGNSSPPNFKPETREKMLEKAISKAEKAVERFEKPMQTGVPEERSEARYHQVKWILEGEDKTKYEDDLNWTRESYPYIPIRKE